MEGLGVYDSVVTYDEIETLDATTPSVVVDMAGANEVTAVYDDMLEGRASPETGHVLSLSPNAFDD